MWFLWCRHRYQDGSEEYTQIYYGKAKAIEAIQKGKNEVNGHNAEYKLFEVGKEVELTYTEELTHPPAPPPVKTIVVGEK